MVGSFNEDEQMILEESLVFKDMDMYLCCTFLFFFPQNINCFLNNIK